MTPLTALDIIGVTATKDGSVYHHTCPWCGGGAWSGRYHMQCASPYCEKQVASALDIVAHACGGDYRAADRVAARKLHTSPSPTAATRRGAERKVLDTWLRICATRPRIGAGRVAARLGAIGKKTTSSLWSAAALDADSIKELLTVAHETGAEVPDSWNATPPAPCVAFCVQSFPHTIDRIVLLRRGSSDIVWHRKAAGISGLIGLQPGVDRLLASNMLRAFELQDALSRNGCYDEVGAVFVDTWADPGESAWYFECGKLVAVVGEAEDIVAHQSAARHFPILETQLAATTTREVADSGRRKFCDWTAMRRNFMRSIVQVEHTTVPAALVSLFERTGSKDDDASYLLQTFRAAGRFDIVADLHRMSENRILRRDGRVVVRETPEDYMADTQYGSHQIANFKLKLDRNVLFRERGETYCAGQLRCGGMTVPVFFPRNLLGLKASKLQEGLQNAVAENGAGAGGLLPTILDAGYFQKYIVPFLTEQVASAGLTDGITSLGWSADRRSFTMPGLRITTAGRETLAARFHPGVRPLRHFGNVTDWSAALAGDIDPTCQDVIAMLLAMTVRFYRRCATTPLPIRQTSDTMRLVDALMGALGQQSILEIGSNAREAGNLDGINGYPFFAAGPSTWAADKVHVPYVLLTDVGYRAPTFPTAQHAQAAGRIAQAALIRVADWCLATGADDFREAQAMDYHVSLLQEGEWLMRHVCGMEAWSVSISGKSALENLFAQIPPAQTKHRIQLIDGEVLAVSIDGLDCDTGALQAELLELGSESSESDGKLILRAAVMLPPLARFYGQRPELAVTDSGA